jgi:hypothetical protein
MQSEIDGALQEREVDPMNEKLVAAMKRIGDLTMDNDVLRTRAGHVAPLARRESWKWWPRSHTASAEPTASPVSVMVLALPVRRSTLGGGSKSVPSAVVHAVAERNRGM